MSRANALITGSLEDQVRYVLGHMFKRSKTVTNHDVVRELRRQFPSNDQMAAGILPRFFGNGEVLEVMNRICVPANTDGGKS